MNSDRPIAWRSVIITLLAAVLLAMPMMASAQTWNDPELSPPDNEGEHSGDAGGSDEPNEPPDNDTSPPPSGSTDQGELIDATGTMANTSRSNKSLEFHSSGARQAINIEYDAGLDSAQGGGTNGGFPYWEANGDWTVTKSARCEVAGRNQMTKVAGTKEQTFSCYVEWMQGSRKYVDLAHCEAGANNTKPAETKSYMPPSCPHPEWVIGNWGSWSYTSNWYRSSGDRGKSCGTITEYRNKKRTRSLSCSGGTYNECKTYNGPVQTTDTGKNSRSRYLGSCSMHSGTVPIVAGYTSSSTGSQSAAYSLGTDSLAGSTSYTREKCRREGGRGGTNYCHTVTYTSMPSRAEKELSINGIQCTLYSAGHTARIRCKGHASGILNQMSEVKLGQYLLPKTNKEKVMKRSVSCGVRSGICRTSEDLWGYEATFGSGNGGFINTNAVGRKYQLEIR